MKFLLEAFSTGPCVPPVWGKGRSWPLPEPRGKLRETARLQPRPSWGQGRADPPSSTKGYWPRDQGRATAGGGAEGSLEGVGSGLEDEGEGAEGGEGSNSIHLVGQPVKGPAVGRSGLAEPGAGAGPGPAGEGPGCGLGSRCSGGWGVESRMRSRHRRGPLKVQQKEFSLRSSWVPASGSIPQELGQ